MRLRMWACIPTDLILLPKSEAEEETKLSIGDVLKQKKSWVMIVNYGVYQFIINACMASMVVWFTRLVILNADAVAAGPLGAAFTGMGGLEGGGAMVLFVNQATRWLSVGALVGILTSFLFGVIDDKCGTPVASLILGITEFLPIIGLMSQWHFVATTGACNVPLLILWGFGVSCMTGGVLTMHPASISFAFGRREYQAANRIIMAIQLIPGAFAAQIMAAMINSGNPMSAWIMCLIVLAIGIIFTILMFKMKTPTRPTVADPPTYLLPPHFREGAPPLAERPLAYPARRTKGARKRGRNGPIPTPLPFSPAVQCFFFLC